MHIAIRKTVYASIILLGFMSVLFTPSRAPAEDLETIQIIANPNVAYTMLARMDVIAYFLKSRTTWDDRSEVNPVILPRDSKVHAEFLSSVMHKTPAEFEAYWYDQIFEGRSRPPEAKKTEAEVLEYVRTTPGAIGYISKSTRAKGVTVIELFE